MRRCSVGSGGTLFGSGGKVLAAHQGEADQRPNLCGTDRAEQGEQLAVLCESCISVSSQLGLF